LTDGTRKLEPTRWCLCSATWRPQQSHYDRYLYREYPHGGQQPFLSGAPRRCDSVSHNRLQSTLQIRFADQSREVGFSTAMYGAAEPPRQRERRGCRLRAQHRSRRVPPPERRVE
jgi:hypothetical protein